MLYLKIAAVNFDATVLDSNDLSTIRGSSLALLRWPRALLAELARDFGKDACFEVVYEGASEAVVHVVPTSTGAQEAPWPDGLPRSRPKGMSKQQWRQKLQEAGLDPRGGPSRPDLGPLARRLEERCGSVPADRGAGWPWHRFTFAAAIHQPAAKESFASTLAVLESRLRTRQLTRATVPIPEAGPARPLASAEAVCAVTGVLAAAPHPRRQPTMSQSVADRRRTGRLQKQEFYEAQLADAAGRAQALDGELGAMTAGTKDSFKPGAREAIAGAPDRLKDVGDRLRAESAGFAQSFRDIVADPPRRLPPGARSKLAVVYVDGNGFGRARAARGHDPVLLGRFSRYLQVRGGLLLADLIAWMLDRRLFVETAPEEEEAPRRLRFETLMWGGDEVCFVLPAWEGMAFMAQLGRSLAGWQKPELGPPGERPHAGLTFAAGMAIGQEKTPIRVLRDAACQLAEAAKANREASHLQVLSLEGIDRAAFNLAALRGAAFRPGPVPEAGTFSLDLERIDAVIEGVLTIKREVGRSQLQHWYSRAARDGRLGESNGGAAAGLRDQMLQRLGELGAGEAALAVLRGDLLAAGAGDHLFLPLHQLLELWDFVQPEATA